MLIHQRFKQIRKKMGLSLKDVFRIQKEVLGDNALSYMTLRRIEKGNISKINNIYLICNAIGVSIPELFKNTEFANRLVIKRNERFNSYTPNEKATYEVISPPSEILHSMELTLLPGGKTPTEHNPIDRGKFEKIVYVTNGRLNVHITEDIYTLSARDSITFDSRIPHYYKNDFSKKCICIITQSPRYL